MTILRDHALNNLWVEPLQDHQHRIQPTKVSRLGGYYKEGAVMWENIPMPNYHIPNDNSRFHVYPLGQLPPKRFALEMKPLVWYSGAQLVNGSDTVIDVYAENGTIVSRDKFYICQNYDRNLILAINTAHGDLGTEEIITTYDEIMEVPYSLDRHPITIRFYHNALIENRTWLANAPVPNVPLKDVDVYIRDTGDFSAFKAEVSSVETEYAGFGRGIYFLEGFLIEKPTAFRSEYLGKTISFRYDETVKDIRDFPLMDIPGFVSKIDVRQNKYLLISDRENKLLDYHDDCDFYLINKDTLGNVKGVRITPFGGKQIRQVTHTAWSLNQNEIIRLSTLHSFLKNVALLTIRVVVRQGGMIRGVGFQHNRIEELYHLDNDQIREAMVGVNSTLPEWQAAELEASDYIKLIGSQAVDITEDLVARAYGYNAATKAVAKTISRKEDGKFNIDPAYCIPYDVNVVNAPKVETRRTFSWYDDKGKYLGSTGNTSTLNMVSAPTTMPTAAQLEVMTGRYLSGVGENGTITDQEVVYDTSYGHYGHRCYVCNLISGSPDHKWVDVTGGNLYQYIEAKDGKPPYIVWNYSLLNAGNYFPAVRIADRINFHKPTYSLASFTGVYEYMLSRLQDSRYMAWGVPTGHVDVIMNGELLIPDLDFYYRDGGNIYIVKKPKTTPTETNIEIRTYGYMNPETHAPFKPRATGFVKNGVLTVNGKFDIYHDRDVRIIMDGRLLKPEDVQFAEGEIDPNGKLHLDGSAFAIVDYQALVEPFTNEATVPYLMKAMDIDNRVSEYLTSRLDDITPVNNYVTPARHLLYSPVMSIFTQLIMTGRLNDVMINLEATDQSILTLFGPLVGMYQDVDPIIQGYDVDFVYIEPHAQPGKVTVTSKQFAFLDRVNRIFLKDVLDLSGHYTIKAGT